MSQVEVEITGMAITARYGTLKTGTILRTDEAYAKHLVEDCAAAKYKVAQEGATAPLAPAAKVPAVPRKRAEKPLAAGSAATTEIAPTNVAPDQAHPAPDTQATATQTTSEAPGSNVAPATTDQTSSEA